MLTKQSQNNKIAGSLGAFLIIIMHLVNKTAHKTRAELQE